MSAARPRPRIHAPLVAAHRWPPPVDWFEEDRERREREHAAEPAEAVHHVAATDRPARPEWHARQMVAAPGR